MNIYRLQSPERFEGRLITLKDSKSRLLDFFVLDQGSDKFLSFSTTEGTAQEGLTYESVSSADFLASNTSIPIFSERSKKVFTDAFPDEIVFYPVKINVESRDCQFFLTKISKKLELIDLARSSFRPLSTGEPILERPIFRKQFDSSFFIARDIVDRITVAVSESFFTLCHEEKLDIGFLQLPQ